MKISLILTVLNEADNIRTFLASLREQSRLPDEVVVCDAGSTDGTINVLREFAASFQRPFKVIVEPGNRSKGRNIAIRQAQFDLIAGTDAGCELDRDWLRKIMSPFEKDETVDVVSGFFAASGKTWFEECAAVVTLSTTNVKPNQFLPSGRSIAFRREVWESVGGFPEDLDFAEDTQFALDLRNAKKKFAFVDDALVYWRPHSSMRRIFRQFRNYARGNREAGILYINYVRFHTRYIIWIILTASLFLTFWAIPVWILAVVPYWLKWSIAGWKQCHNLPSLFVVPSIKLVVDAGQFIGFWSSIRTRRKT